MRIRFASGYLVARLDLLHCDFRTEKLMKYITQKMWRLENLELPWSIQKPIAVSLSSPEQTFEAIERIERMTQPNLQFGSPDITQLPRGKCRQEHHPDIDIRYNKVRLILSTHAKGGLTEAGHELVLGNFDMHRNAFT